MTKSKIFGSESIQNVLKRILKRKSRNQKIFSITKFFLGLSHFSSLWQGCGAGPKFGGSGSGSEVSAPTPAPAPAPFRLRKGKFFRPIQKVKKHFVMQFLSVFWSIEESIWNCSILEKFLKFRNFSKIWSQNFAKNIQNIYTLSGAGAGQIYATPAPTKNVRLRLRIPG